ncbi:MAG: ABC transporter permease subunit [Clostridia bacterium]|nr:ABC transporter permease subunit [Clostridia bacterium]
MTRSINPRKLRSYKEFLYVLPFLIIVALFSYFPLYGWIYAFHDYRPPFPITNETFVGFKWFQTLVNNPIRLKGVLRVLRNTFVMSGVSLAFSWFPMVFAVFLNEIKCKPFKKFVQTVTTLPNFISWVLVYAIAFALFSTNGAVNSVLTGIGAISQPISFLTDTNGIYFKMWLWLTWKNAGWAAIMYLAAISGIDEQMIEAAKVDGATRMQIIWHITIPSLLPTYFVIVMLNLANFLSNGMEQYFVFQNAFTQDYVEVLDLYVYNIANSGPGMYPFATVISILKSVVSVVLLFVTNTASRLIRGEGFI